MLFDGPPFIQCLVTLPDQRRIQHPVAKHFMDRQGRSVEISFGRPTQPVIKKKTLLKLR